MSSVHVYLQSPTKLSTLSRSGATRFSAEPRWRSAAPFNEVHAYLPHASTLRRNRAPVLRAPIDPPRRPTITPPHAYLTSPTKLSTLRRTGSAVFGPRPSSRTADAPTALDRKGIELRAAAVEIQRIVDSAATLDETREALSALARRLNKGSENSFEGGGDARRAQHRYF